MGLVEFIAHEKNGFIRIPEKYQKKMKGQLKVILFKEEENKQKNRISLEISKIYEIFKNQNPFQHIDSIDWQKSIRDEW